MNKWDVISTVTNTEEKLSHLSAYVLTDLKKHEQKLPLFIFLTNIWLASGWQILCMNELYKWFQIISESWQLPLHFLHS